jgi:hypothetical protein
MRVRAIAGLGALVWLGGCAGGLPGLGLTQIEPAPQAQTAVGVEIDPKDVPPLPSRRPGAAVAAKTGESEPAAATARAPGFMGTLSSLIPAGLGADAEPSDRAEVREDPVTVYARIASGIKSCWLNRANPALPNHKFHADASPEGEASIIIHEKVQGATLGRAAFRIRVERDGRGASVRSENVRLDEKLKPAMLRDVANWTAGAGGCATRHAGILGNGAPQ